MHIFSNHETDDNRRPDILIRSPYEGGKLIIIDVALSGIDGTTRTNDEKADQPSIARRKQKTRKYRPTAMVNGLDFRAASFFYAGQMDVVIKNLLLEQITVSRWRS
jgi:hypothetical protein